jgi:hypothetical protein
MSIERILAHITKEENGCWLWVGTCDKGTSPVLRVSQPTRKLVSARRYAYEAHNQVCVPSDFVVTATCKVSKCVNPAHLVALKRGKQGHRLIGDWKPEHCQHGHEFSVWNTGHQNSGKRFCIACDKDHAKRYMAQRRAENPQHEKDLRDARRKLKQSTIDALKALFTCQRCGESNPICLDFHHSDPSQKDETISTLVYHQRSLDVIIAEAKKCQVLCANCHRLVHAAEKLEGKE